MIDPDELIFVVDEDNKPLKPLPRVEVHDKGMWHRVAHIWVVNKEGMILCQRRSILKDHDPGKMESVFGGHMEPNAEAEMSALRELSEELGIVASSLDLRFFGVFKAERKKEFQTIFVYFWDGELADLKLEEEEVESVDLYKIHELEEIFKSEDEDWVIQGCELDVLEFIKSEMRAEKES